MTSLITEPSERTTFLATGAHARHIREMPHARLHSVREHGAPCLSVTKRDYKKGTSEMSGFKASSLHAVSYAVCESARILGKRKRGDAHRRRSFGQDGARCCPVFRWSSEKDESWLAEGHSRFLGFRGTEVGSSTDPLRGLPQLNSVLFHIQRRRVSL